MRLTRFVLPGCALVALAGAPASAFGAGGSALQTSSSTNTTKKAAKKAHKTKRALDDGTQVTNGPGGAGMGGPVEGPSTPEQPTVPGDTAKIIKGVAYAPSYAPMAVKKAIWAGNQIRHKPYIYGGGHGVWNDAGYDCSGSVSYVLHAAGLLKTSEDSSGFESWGQRGLGQWITVYTNPSHAFVEIAGIRLDTSAEDDPSPPPGTGPRWRPVMNGAPGFMARHPGSL